MTIVDIKNLYKGVYTNKEEKEFTSLEEAQKFVEIFNEAAFYSESPDGGTFAEIRKI